MEKIPATEKRFLLQYPASYLSAATATAPMTIIVVTVIISIIMIIIIIITCKFLSEAGIVSSFCIANVYHRIVSSIHIC